MIKYILILSFKKKFTFSMLETSDDKSVCAFPNSTQHLLLLSWLQEQTPHRHCCSPRRTLRVFLHQYSPNHAISSVTKSCVF